MQIPQNHFRDALRAGRTLIGLWVGLADANAAEALATTGYDWLLLDGEHAPNDPRSVLSQLRAVAPYPVHPVVRPVVGDVALVKQYLDVGAQTLLVPMIDTAEQAARVVAATRYPPKGIRGLGTGLARAARWNQVTGYLHKADEELCVLVQVETVKGMANLEAIAAVEGVDGVFFGPSDLSASMGFLGRVDAPEVMQAIAEGIAIVRRAGKAAGILAVEPTMARRCLELGAQFVAVGVDTTLLARASRELLQSFKTPSAAAADAGRGSGY